MNIIHWILFSVSACGFVVLIMSFHKMSKFIPSGHIEPESYFISGCIPFICSVVVILVDMVLCVAIEVQDVYVRRGVVLFMTIIATVLLIILHDSVGAGLQKMWAKIKAPPTAAPSKHPWLSKTIIFNAAVAAMVLAERNIASLQGFLSPGAYQALFFMVPIVNMLLRAITTQGLSFTPTAYQADLELDRKTVNQESSSDAN